MKKFFLFFIFPFFLICACSEKKPHQENEIGYLTLNINQSPTMKADVEIDGFTLRIHNGSSDAVNDLIENLPEHIALPVGHYTIEVFSMEFNEPKFDTPFYSGKTTVDIEAGETKEVSLVCSQGNAGIKAVWSNDFPILFGTYQLQIFSDEGYLNYSSTETRTGYFLPGTVTISILADGQTFFGGTITLAARDMVTLNLRPKETTSENITISIIIDDSVNERELELTIDIDDPTDNPNPNSETNPYNIAEAIANQGENAVWISGYIVGAKPSSGYDFVNGAWQDTNIVLADNIEETDDRKVIFVELGTVTSVYRINLNLLNNSDILHQKVNIKGNLLAYQSRSGLRNISGYSFP